MKPYGQETRWHVDSDYATKDVRSHKRTARQEGKAEVEAGTEEKSVVEIRREVEAMPPKFWASVEVRHLSLRPLVEAELAWLAAMKSAEDK